MTAEAVSVISLLEVPAATDVVNDARGLACWLSLSLINLSQACNV